MFDYDVVIIGGGPCGLTAGLYLSRSNRRTILLEKENFGGAIKNVDWIENYPGFAEGVSGGHLAAEMVTQATNYGLQLKQTDVVGIEVFSSSTWISCADGTGYSCSLVIIAGGARRKKLGVPGEEVFEGKGVFNCALCDGGKFIDRVVAVCGGGDAGVTEALYLTRLASKVILLEAMPMLTASAILQERASLNSKLEICRGVQVEALVGGQRLEGIQYVESASGKRAILKADGLLVYVGLQPNTSYLKDLVPLDDEGRIIVNNRMETEVPRLFAAGDIRSGSPGQIASAVGDGSTAAVSAQRLLQELM